MTTRGQKIIVVFIGIFTALLLLEISLRITGFFYQKYQASYKPPPFAAGKDHYTILCEGASYTRGMGAPQGKGFPNHLEHLLNENSSGKRYRVINRAVSGQNTAQLLSKLQRNIDETRPDLVILLIGRANKSNRWGYHGYTGHNYRLSRLYDTLYNIRIFQLAMFFINDISEKEKAPGTREARPYSIMEGCSEKKALEDTRINIAKNPEDATPYFCMGLYYLDQRNIEKAIPYFKQGIKINPRDGACYYGMSEANRLLGRFDEARAWAEKGIKSDPKNGRNYYAIAYIETWLGRYDSAAKWLKKAAEADPHITTDRYFTYTCGRLGRYMLEIGRCPDGYNEFIQELKLIVAKSRAKSSDTASASTQLNTKPFDQAGFMRLWAIPEALKFWVSSDIKKIIEICHSQGIAVIVQNYPNGTDSFNECIRETAAQCSVPFVDNHRVFKSLWDRGEEPKEYFEWENGTGHCNANGYRQMAENIYDKMAQEHILGVGNDEPAVNLK